MEPIKIDGGWGEGGGQIIRSAVTLSAITGKPVEKKISEKTERFQVLDHNICLE
ncbi:hypothetical protein DYY66_1608 [Candidatus Nitrosotalea sp. FS]|uniref:RNA 3'-terminal phosphate cyclase n=1 Tax=Candidatus Nitrosotalea sp. FS TaxID=2341021 RepID=UPI002107423B|nr:RNA 3'-terminal phosphate cyclase [Candidatus Nitrosotalea sp. FS]NHH98706.1 hypothetical protein [Candidatus Nitrosotalea sp. FS]